MSDRRASGADGGKKAPRTLFSLGRSKSRASREPDLPPPPVLEDEVAPAEDVAPMAAGVDAVECPSCATTMPRGARFCGECGTALPEHDDGVGGNGSVVSHDHPDTAEAEPAATGDAADEEVEYVEVLVCPTCEAELPDDAQFCGECGTAVVIEDDEAVEDGATDAHDDDAAVLPPPPPPVAVDADAALAGDDVDDEVDAEDEVEDAAVAGDDVDVDDEVDAEDEVEAREDDVDDEDAVEAREGDEELDEGLAEEEQAILAQAEADVDGATDVPDGDVTAVLPPPPPPVVDVPVDEEPAVDDERVDEEPAVDVERVDEEPAVEAAEARDEHGAGAVALAGAAAAGGALAAGAVDADVAGATTDADPNATIDLTADADADAEVASDAGAGDATVATPAFGEEAVTPAEPAEFVDSLTGPGTAGGAQPEPGGQPPSRSRKGVWLGAAAVVVLIVLVAGGALLAGGGGGDGDDEVRTERAAERRTSDEDQGTEDEEPATTTTAPPETTAPTTAPPTTAAPSSSAPPPTPPPPAATPQTTIVVTPPPGGGGGGTPVGGAAAMSVTGLSNPFRIPCNGTASFAIQNTGTGIGSFLVQGGQLSFSPASGAVAPGSSQTVNVTARGCEFNTSLSISGTGLSTSVAVEVR